MKTKNKKIRILIDAFGGKNWIGGLYYKRNILYSILQNKWIRDNLEIYVLTEKENRQYFDDFIDNITIIEATSKMYRLKVLYYAVINRAKYIYPVDYSIPSFLKITPIYWLPDFQHRYYPGNFSNQEIENRDALARYIAKSSYPLILSSKTCEEDFVKFYGEKKECYILHFVSFIENYVNGLSPELEKEIMGKYGLYKKKYACVMNQFWIHKNHEVVFKAIKKLSMFGKCNDLIFVFTGTISDYRNTEYGKRIIALIDEEQIKDRIVMLGFISRQDQICIMKNAEFVIQPSLFEGWGTVLEDSRVLDKTLILSDIPVHREQMYDKCILFDPLDAEDLLHKIERESLKEHISDKNKGLMEMKKRAITYSNSFEQLLRNITW